MWNKPTAKDLKDIPAFYATEKIPPQDKVIHLHFFLGGCDWYACDSHSPPFCKFFNEFFNRNLSWSWVGKNCR